MFWAKWHFFKLKCQNKRAFITIQLLTGWSGTSTAGMYYINLYKYTYVMIINEIVNRIVFQQRIYITRYFAVLLTASTGVASLGPLLSLDGFHRQ